MKRSDWLGGLRSTLGRTRRGPRRHANRQRANRRAGFEKLEDRRLLAVDFGDSPDTFVGTGPGNYNTVSTDNGAQHTIVVGLRMGANVDGDGGALQNATATADDVNGALPDDEDGLTNPVADLVLTIGAQPTVNVRVTNTTGAAATLYGWIDYNANGVFENATERASIAVPSGSNNVIRTLAFPTVPSGFTGTTFARFRLSADVSAANSTGPASDGEVEDYRVTITAPSSGLADSAKTKKIASGTGGGPTLANSDYFGRAVTSIGDLDGDGVGDLAVGANGDDSGGAGRGAVDVLFMNSNGTVRSVRKIAYSSGANFYGGANGDYLGSSIASLGDLDGDGITDLVVGAERSDAGGTNRGSVWILRLNSDGTVKGSLRMSNGSGGISLANGDYFGRSVASIGDVDGDGITDIAVGAYGDDTGGSDRGAVHIAFMNPDSSVKSTVRIGSGIGGGPTLANGDRFGSSIASLGDMDGDGVTDLAVGAVGDDTGGIDRGAVHVLFMNANGTVKSRSKIADDSSTPVVSGVVTLVEQPPAIPFASPEAALGAPWVSYSLGVSATGGALIGAVDVKINAQLHQRWTDADEDGVFDPTPNANSAASLTQGDSHLVGPVGALFGRGPAEDNPGTGSPLADTSTRDYGVGTFLDGAWGVMNAQSTASVAYIVIPSGTESSLDIAVKVASPGGDIIADLDEDDFFGSFPPGLSLNNGDQFGRSIASLGDLDGDGITDIAVGSYYDDTGGNARGAVNVLFLNADGSVKSAQKIASDTGGGPTLTNDDRFGVSVAAMGDLDGDGKTDLAVGASFDDTGGTNRGAVYTLFLKAVNTPPVITSPATASVPENQASVMTVVATDADTPPQTLTYSIVGGVDQARFTISAGGALSFVAPPNYEVPTDSNNDNVYVVQVQVSDGAGGIDTQDIQVTVTPVNDNDPVFTTSTAANVAENSTAVMTVNAIDADVPAQTITYSISGGTDQAKFTITSGGALSFIAVPDFELPGDSNGDNVYLVTVRADDNAGRTTDRTILVTVTPENDNSPVFTSSSNISIAERTTAVAAVTATDADLPVQILSFSIVGGVDQSKFAITSGGALSFVTPPQFLTPTDANGDNVYVVTVQANDGAGRTTTQTINTSVTSATDLGDAPDATGGTGTGNYNTRFADNGPSHSIVPGLRLGATVDGDNGLLQNSAANADNTSGALPIDEDGLTNPAADLVLTVGAAPTINVRATNTTGTSATLFGWIDYNANGVFENATERTSVAVPNGTNNSIVTMVFPAVPFGFTGTSYARFRMSSDGAAANPTGAALGGEVEDYRVAITRSSSGTADTAKYKKIANNTSGGPTLANGDAFGNAVVSIGDLNGDGVNDLVVGAQSVNAGAGGGNGGALHVLFMNANGTVQSSQKIGNGIGGGPSIAPGDYFGRSVAAIGDLDGDGITDLAVGADRDNTGGSLRGAVYVLFMNANGTAKGSQKIAHNTGGGPSLMNVDRFGVSVTALGDLDGDGVTDLAVGATGDDTGGSGRGAVHVLFLNSNGTVKSLQKICSGSSGAPTLANSDYFGASLAGLGDVDGDGVTDLAAGAWGDDSGGTGRGAVHVLLLNTNGTVKSSQKIANGVGGGPSDLANNDFFGSALAAVGDLDGDGVTDLAAGSRYDDTGGTDRGAIHVLYLTSSGTAKGSQKIANGVGGGPTLADGDIFGRAIGSIGDLDGDGVNDLAVGAERDDTGGSNRGAVHVLFLKKFNAPPSIISANTANVAENSSAVMNVTATDPDLPVQPITFSIVGGADQARFTITGGGALSFIAAPDYEAPSDANLDNLYVVTVEANDGEGGTTTQTIEVSVTPVNDNTPQFTSTDSANVAENSASVMTVTATDADLPAQSIAYSIVGGADQSKFSINAGGALSFITAPNFEAPGDSNVDNVYVVVVQASDGSRTNVQAILVTVTPLNDNSPVFNSDATKTIPENSTAVMTVSATDVDLPAQLVSYSIVGGVDQAKFSITSGGGLSFLSAPDYEAPNDTNMDNVYVVNIQADDGAGRTTTQSISVTISPLNDNIPVFTSPTAINLPENSTAVMNVTATDADQPPQSLTYSIVGGADQAKVTVSGGGALAFITAPNFEAPTDSNGDGVYVVTVRASDGALTEIQTILVTITNVNELLDGDYNHNNTVDAADYTVWADRGIGSLVARFSAGDGNGNGVIDSEDYAIWRNNFGNTAPGGGAAATLKLQQDEEPARDLPEEESTTLNGASQGSLPMTAPLRTNRNAPISGHKQTADAHRAATHDVALLSLLMARRRTRYEIGLGDFDADSEDRKAAQCLVSESNLLDHVFGLASGDRSQLRRTMPSGFSGLRPQAVRRN